MVNNGTIDLRGVINHSFNALYLSKGDPLIALFFCKRKIYQNKHPPILSYAIYRKSESAKSTKKNSESAKATQKR